MNTHMTRRVLRAFFAVLLFATAHGAHAGLFRAYLSVNGNDANPCTVAAPCRLLPAALAAANDGGEVWMLDSANFNTGTVTVGKSVTILAIPGVLGSIVANGGNAIFINGAGAKVTLRNLNVLNLAGGPNYGIYMAGGAELTVENCEIYGMAGGIMAMYANTTVAIKDTVIRDTTSIGVDIYDSAKATLDGVHLLNNSTGLAVGAGASASVSNSVIAGNSANGIVVQEFAAKTSRLVLTNSVLNGNSYGIASRTWAATDVVSIALHHNALSGNGIGVDASSAVAGSTLTVVLDDNVFVANATAIYYWSPAVVFSRGNNTLKLNGSDVTGPALTALVGL